MMPTLRYFIFLLATVGCIDTIEVELPSRTGGRLVLAGVVERGPDNYRFLVDVTRTQNLEEEGPAFREEVDIRLLHLGAETLTLTNGENMLFPIDSFHLIFGGIPEEARFNLIIRTVHGSTFTSLDQKILESPADVEPVIRYEERSELNDIGNVVERGFVKLLINSSLINAASERVSLRWDVSGVYKFPEIPWTDDPFIFVNTCYVKVGEKANQINIINSAQVNHDEVNEIEIHETESDYRFAVGYYYTILQKAISNDAASYWQEVKKGVSRDGTIFDTPAGQIRSNIIQTEGPPEELLGYFYTSGVDTIRYLATREEAGKPLQLCAFQTISEACCDCLLLVNSTYDKPSYWIE